MPYQAQLPLKGIEFGRFYSTEWRCGEESEMSDGFVGAGEKDRGMENSMEENQIITSVIVTN